MRRVKRSKFRRRIRNVGADVLETTLQFRPGANVKIELYSDGRFTASFAGATEKTVAIKLQPGADEPIAGSEFRIETKSIQPGRYFVEAYDGFRIGDPPDAKQQVVASSPNWRHIPSDLPLAFDVVAANAPVPAESKPFVLKGGPEIAWGEPVQGLQAGVRYVRVKNPPGGNVTDDSHPGVRFTGLLNPRDFSDPVNWQWKIGETVDAEIVVRNVSSEPTPLTFAVTRDDELVELTPLAHSVQVSETSGPLLRRHMKSRVAWHEGHEPTDRERTVNLRPGETVVVARTAFQLLTEPENRADIAKLPRVDAFLVKDVARYSFRTRMLVRGPAAADLAAADRSDSPVGR